MMGAMDATSSGRHRRPRAGTAEGTDPDDLLRALLGGAPAYTRREVSAKARVSVHSSRKLWQALGFPMVSSDAPTFTEADLQALRSVARMVREGVLDEPTALAMTRALARSMDRLAIWQAQLMAEALAPQPGGADAAVSWAMSDPQTARDAARVILQMADDVEPLLVYVWRRHLTDALLRMIADSGASPDHDGVVRCVGFADLVSFTNLVRTLSERELARVVQRFEGLASEIVTQHGGRVIKTVGDEAMFVAQDPRDGASIALDLVAAIAEEKLLPDVRVGLAYGKVIGRLGDVFGVTVNRASRLTGIAAPGTVVSDEALAGELRPKDGFVLRKRRRRRLRGVGDVVPWVVSRPPAALTR